jgi:putative sigma-54 modulation protein
MELKIQGSNTFTLTDSIKNYIEKRIEKLNYFQGHIDKIALHLETEKLLYKIHGTISIIKFGVFKFESDAEEMYSAIDKIIHKMDVKIHREKTKIQDHSNFGHEEVNELFVKEEDNKSPTMKHLEILTKPTTLDDAYLQMKDDESDLFGFNLINEDNIIAPAFLRKADDDVVYLFRQDKEESYSEILLKVAKNQIKEGKKIRNFLLKKINLTDAQKDILEQEYFYNIFIDINNNKINFLSKLDNGKWMLIS